MKWAVGFYGAATFGMLAWLVIDLIRLVRCSEVVVPLKAKPFRARPPNTPIPTKCWTQPAQLDLQGDWDAAIAFYADLARRWPEHEAYIRGCIQRVEEKQSRL